MNNRTPEQARIRQRKRRKENPAKMRNANVRSDLRIRYGLSVEQYQAIFDKQNGRCAICARDLYSRLDITRPKLFSDRSTHAHTARVDHCHTTNRVRGLLCNSCNIGLGKFFDNNQLLLNAIRYLNESSTGKQGPLEER